MRYLAMSRLAAVLLPVGLAVALAGFFVGPPAARTGLQLLGLMALTASVLMTLQIVTGLAKDTQ